MFQLVLLEFQSGLPSADGDAHADLQAVCCISELVPQRGAGGTRPGSCRALLPDKRSTTGRPGPLPALHSEMGDADRVGEGGDLASVSARCSATTYLTRDAWRRSMSGERKLLRAVVGTESKAGIVRGCAAGSGGVLPHLRPGCASPRLRYADRQPGASADRVRVIGWCALRHRRRVSLAR